MSKSERVMYHGTVRALPLQEQLRAAALAGCSALTTGPWEYLQHRANGLTARDLKAMAADAGVRFDHLDPFVRWLPHWQPDDSIGPVPLAFLDHDADAFFRMADELEARSFSAVAACPPGRYTLNELIDCFGRLCDRSARHGLRADLEFIAFWGISDLATAWHIVDAVNAPNSGILLDFWHYHRGRPDDELLRTLPGHRITGVQLDDADAVLAPGVGILDDTLNRRKPPGQGEFRVREVVSILRTIDGLNNVGPEIFSAEFDTLGAEDIAARCRASVDWALQP